MANPLSAYSMLHEIYLDCQSCMTRGKRGVIAASVLVVVPCQPDGQPVDRRFVLRVRVDELGELLGQPGERHRLLAAPLGQFLDAAIGEVHRKPPGQRSAEATSAA